MSDRHSVTDLLRKLADSEEHSEAAEQVWSRYIEQLISLASKKLKELPRRVVDEEDVAVLAFEAFFRGMREGRFRQVANRNDLWQVLAMLTDRKAVGFMREQLAEKRGAGKVRGESAFGHQLDLSGAGPGLNSVADPNDASLEVFTDSLRTRLDKLEPRLRQIAFLRLEGKSNSEIAAQVGIAVRSVERKMKLIRDSWDKSDV